ncbi:MAG: 16S rRNA (cytosine(967)-C(5))-methyltransferase RsmB [Lachnospiraceae bacterium]|nr:16S rRNA (cytosine(967)-C(5))-methyltransferase RsmB [Lachnospiraceae bacterium]
MTSSVNLRELALQIILAVIGQESYSHIILAEVLKKYQYLEKRERAFITKVSQGTIEHMIELDYIIDRFSKTPISKMKPAIHGILCMAVYELKYMDAIPASASCNEAVKLAKRKGFSNLSGFVNGVLRSIERGLGQFKYPQKNENETEYLSITYSLPKWLVALWQKTYSGEEIEEMGKAFLAKRFLTIRVNTAQTTVEQLKQTLSEKQIQVKEDETLPYALHIAGIDHLEKLSEFLDGDFYVQDISSMLAMEEAGLQEGLTVLDVCGSPGGKGLYAAQEMHGTGMVYCRDVSAKKVQKIKDNISRCRVTNMKAQLRDATVSDAADREAADIVLADLPCSGLGVLGKKPDIKYRMNPDRIQSLIQVQRSILDVVCNYVRPGGILLYSTCTIDRMENEDNAAWFQEKHPEFELEIQRQILPQEYGCDGFFYAKFRKTG